MAHRTGFLPKAAVTLSGLALLTAVSCSEGPAATEDRCIQHMTSQHTAALSTNGCREVMGIAKYCTAMATVIGWKLDHGQSADRLQRLYYRQC